VPSQTRRTHLETLRDELIRSFQNPDNLNDPTPFFESVPESSARHNHLPSPISPLFELSDLPSPLSFAQPSLPHSTPSTPQPLTMSDAPTSAKPLMPLKGDRGAPTFNPDRPSELSRFFRQLEALFLRSGITSDEEKKDYVISYVDASLADLWEGIPSFKSATSTYDDFKAAVLECYTDQDRKYNVSDLDMLIGERQRLGIRSLNELSEYHLRFQAVTSYLLEKKLIGEIEQFNAFVRSFSATFWKDISRRLQVKYPDHFPDLPYKISEVYEAARFVLHGLPTGSSAIPIPSIPSQKSSPSSASYTPTPSQPIDSPPTIKAEQLGSILTEFTKTIVEAIKQANVSNNRPSSSNYPRSTACNMCGKEHYIRDCDVVSEYIRAGKCRRNTEGKVVLPSGSFIPKDIPGTLLRDRFDEWHRRNPNQLASGTLSSGTLFHSVLSAGGTPSSPPPSQSLYQLSTTDRIASLEAELFNLRARQPGFTPVIRTRAQKARNANADPDDDPAPVQPPVNSESDQPRATSIPPTSVPAIPFEPKGPEHPFRNAQDATYIPPQDRNVGALPKPAAPKKAEPAYRTLPPIHDQSIATDVYNRSLNTPVTITQRELLSLSPEVRAQLRDAVTTRRIPNKDSAQQNLINEFAPDFESDFTPQLSTFAIPPRTHQHPPAGATIIPDHFETYLRSLRPGESPDPNQLIVAKESSALRAIQPLVDNTLHVESILDPGCQIIAMSEDVCHELSLSYDPSIRLNMQSANGTVDQSLGLARNVPFYIGDLTVYMQVHVIRRPAYDILLGRPFDILTESVVRNYANEDQTITIHDPNSGRVATIPTIPRGPPRVTCRHHSNQGFHR
jgi:hypothetical protein